MRQTTIKLLSIYGAVTGAVIILSVIATIELDVAYQWLGYLIMLIAFSAIVVATKQYRDEMSDGSLRFGTGFLIGLGITSVASVVYVLGWETYLFFFGDDFWAMFSDFQGYGQGGLSEAELTALTAETNALRQQYENPLFRIPVTFLEVFPVGVIVSLICAAILRKPAGDR